MKNRGGQLTIFIIIAVLIVAAVAAYFVFRGTLVKEVLPPNIQVVETSFLTCLEDDLLTGIDVLESQGGYIELPEFEPGSDFMPFSSQLDFLGNPIPYWYYVSGNNIEREQVPTKKSMENQLEEFIESQIQRCSFEDFYTLDYEISKGEPLVEVTIRDDEVEINLDMDLDIAFEGGNAIVKEHNQIVKSNLGSLYDSARKVYDYEQENLFLEEYAIDNLRLYAPVDGFEVSCSPLSWNADEVFSDLENAIEINTMALTNLERRENYFVIDLPVEKNQEVNFVNSRKWTKTFEVLPSEENLLLANPIGNQPELSILGFCYVPYHFVYDIKYPVLVQISEEDETFQFPMAVILQGNNPRVSLDTSAIETESIGLCENKNTPIRVNVLDDNSNPVKAEISYECFGEICRMGETSAGVFEGDFPQCVNGLVGVKAEGFKNVKNIFSTTQEGSSITIYLERVYDLPVNLNLDGLAYGNEAIISFISEDFSKTILYPTQKSVELTEGFYEIEVKIYKDANIEFGEATNEQCVEVPIGIFGLTREKCFEVEIPSQVLSKALAGGGSQGHFILDSELRSSSSIEINVGSLPHPTTIEQLQDNYVLVEINGVDLDFR